MSLDTIAREDLETAIADLRNAALVVEHAGHHRGSLMAAKTGALCALAAVEVATYRPLEYLSHVGVFVLNTNRRTTFRTHNALRVLADFLPPELCDKCLELYAEEPGDFATQVAHYNDFHCPSGTVLVNMMHLAADEALNNLVDRRKILTGLPA